VVGRVPSEFPFGSTKCSRGHSEGLVRVPTSSQLADIITKDLHYQQWQAYVEGILSKTVRST
jgi:hypothetical protein